MYLFDRSEIGKKGTFDTSKDVNDGGNKTFYYSLMNKNSFQLIQHLFKNLSMNIKVSSSLNSSIIKDMIVNDQYDKTKSQLETHLNKQLDFGNPSVMLNHYDENVKKMLEIISITTSLQ